MRPACRSVAVTVGELRQVDAGSVTEITTLASPKSSTFTVPSRVILMFAGFKSRWTMPFLVRGLEGLGDLAGDRQGLGDRHWPRRDALGERRPVDQFHDQARGRRRASSRP